MSSASRRETMAVAEPQIDARVPEGVPTNLVALWYDDTWRDLDAAATFALRQEVIFRLSGAGHPEPSGSGFGGAVLGVAAVGLGLAAMRQKKRR